MPLAVGTKAKMRLAHIFEMREGKENVCKGHSFQGPAIQPDIMIMIG